MRSTHGRSAIRLAIGLSVVLAPGMAAAHFKLTAPADWLMTNATGDPQKIAPCGASAGMRTGAVTRVAPGSKLKLSWTETVPHPGHYRISIAADRAELKDPVPVVRAGNCESLAIQTNPAAPVVADGVFVHTTALPRYDYEITVPNITCPRCTLQIIQFMSMHAPSCFYYHCADLEITSAVDGGTTPADAGSGGTPGTGGAGGGAARDGAAGAGGAAGGASGSGGRPGTGGTGGSGGGGGVPGAGGATGTGGTAASGGTGAGAQAGQGAPMTGGTDGGSDGGCGCRVGGHARDDRAPALLFFTGGLLAAAAGRARARRSQRRP